MCLSFISFVSVYHFFDQNGSGDSVIAQDVSEAICMSFDRRAAARGLELEARSNCAIFFALLKVFEGCDVQMRLKRVRLI